MEISKIIKKIRVLYYKKMRGPRRILYYLECIRFHRLSIKLGFSIPVGVFNAGISIAHYGGIVVSNNAKVGKNCRINECVNIGVTNGSDKAPIIGNNVFI